MAGANEVTFPQVAEMLLAQAEQLHVYAYTAQQQAKDFHAFQEMGENEQVAVRLAIDLTDKITKLIPRARQIATLTFPPGVKDEVPSPVQEGAAKLDEGHSGS